MQIAYCYAADVNVAIFDAIFDCVDSNVRLYYHDDATLLVKARQNGAGAVRMTDYGTWETRQKIKFGRIGIVTRN